MKIVTPNLLIEESSPYLRQHAHNPVKWMPWNENTLSEALKNDRLMIISIGYSACHWCHVMERESFMDEEVAKLMNCEYISVKVDREERPDIDHVYMQAAQLITGSGGWPLNVIALPDGRPVYAGTYFPKKKWIEVLSYFAGLYRSQKDMLVLQAGNIAEGMNEQLAVPAFENSESITKEHIDEVAEKILGRLDPDYGGLCGAPKFPMPSVFEFLLHYYHLSDEKIYLKAVRHTLSNMMAGGIYDHLGGGFCRYATDAEWKIPHFEKMLYDNGQLLSLFANIHSISPDNAYEKVIRETIAFARRELLSPEGGFYSSLDADSEGMEGKYYTWNKAEIMDIAGPDGEAICHFFGVTSKGNWTDNRNILLKNTGLSGASAISEKTIALAKGKLLEARENRPRPARDDKILTSWNALMLCGLLDAYSVLGDENILQLALVNAKFLKKEMLSREGKVYRNYHERKRSINGFLDDYAFLAMAFIKLYRATFEESWLHTALKITRYVLSHFYDPSENCFYYNANEDPALIIRPVEYTDNVIPSPVSVTISNLMALHKYYDLPEMDNIYRKAVENMVPGILENPVFYANWAKQALKIYGGQFEIVIAGPHAERLGKEIDKFFLPSSILAGIKKRGTFLNFGYKYIEGKTLIYVCSEGICHEACESAEEAIKTLQVEIRRKMSV